MAGEQTGKVCAACGKDVSNLPRVKDAQGRYICAACQEQFKAKLASGPGNVPAAGSGGGLMDKLIGDSPMINAQKCPGCGDPMRAGSVVCLRCGYDVREGRAMKTRVMAEKAPKNTGPVTIRRRGEFGPSFGVLLLLFSGATVVPAVLSSVLPPLLIVSYLIFMLIGFVGYIWGIVAAFRSGQARFGIYGLIPLINLVYIFWVLFINEDKWSRAMNIAYWLGVIVYLFMMMTFFGGPDGFIKALGLEGVA